MFIQFGVVGLFALFVFKVVEMFYRRKAKPMRNEIIEMNGTRWKVREAVSKDQALAAIAEARVTGSIGLKMVQHSVLERGGVDKVVLADVVQINSDDTERKPYTAVY
jgi:hypothetical protein